MSGKSILGLALAFAFIAAPLAHAGQLPPQWFLGKWRCKLGPTPMTMTGAAGEEIYVFHNMLRGVRVNMDVIAHTPTTVSMRDEAGNILSLRSQIRVLGPKMTGTGTIDGVVEGLSCFKNIRPLAPTDKEVWVLPVPTQ